VPTQEKLLALVGRIYDAAPGESRQGVRGAELPRTPREVAVGYIIRVIRASVYSLTIGISLTREGSQPSINDHGV